MKLDLARRHHKWENGGTTSLEQLQEQDDASGWLDQFSQPVLLSVDVSVAQCIQPIVVDAGVIIGQNQSMVPKDES